MQPRTKQQKEIIRLSRSLPNLSEKQRLWACENTVDRVGLRTKKRIICTECGNRFSDCMGFEDGETDICPHCGCKLVVKTSPKRTDRKIGYFNLVTVAKGYQVIRYFYMERTGKADKKAHYYIQEVIQRWLLPDGSFETLARTRNMCSYRCEDIWCHSSSLEIRGGDHPDYYVPCQAVYPVRRYIREIKRNGFKGVFYGIPPFHLFQLILTDSRAETLLKAKQYSLLSYLAAEHNYDVSYFWSSIKICIRNHYIVRDAGIWKDYLNLLEYFGKDLHNSKYVCPKNLEVEHDRLMNKKREKKRKELLEKKKEYIAKSEIKYRKMKKKFMRLSFSDGYISIRVLENVREFLEEGDELQHCVFTNDYFAKSDSLILSARIGDKRIETIEVSLRNFEVVQSRGRKNRNSEYHDRIVALVRQNMQLIRQRATA